MVVDNFLWVCGEIYLSGKAGLKCLPVMWRVHTSFIETHMVSVDDLLPKASQFSAIATLA